MTKDEFEKQAKRCAVYKKLSIELNTVNDYLEKYDEVVDRARVGDDAYRLRTLSDAIHGLEDSFAFSDHFDTEKILEDIDKVIQEHFKEKIKTIEDSIKNI